MPRFTVFRPLVILSIFFATQGVLGAAAGGAGLTCSNFVLIGSGSSAAIQAVCDTGPDGSPPESAVTTSILIDDCVANQNGVLACVVNGHAANTCTFSTLSDVSSTSINIEGTCGNSNGGTTAVPGFNIVTCLTNTNGILTC
ncbi:hypothetical protein BDN72DRAFT_897331 [Pluteus cervinus]|uniref:Uncharacterized protein n=1 Tax=Pluteus cervinus TaxID=181527 RepID=A0ACD3AVY5_9AGAR|nr:hypothetical protein BDN72DRAFT_897331 [Pluteus cervinus]